MDLLFSPASPFARKVRVLIREGGLTGRVTEREVSTEVLGTAGDVVAANPLGKIPALIRDDGPALYDSRVITRYLDTLADRDVYPQARLWEVLTLEATADAIMEAALAITYEARFRPEAQRSPDWVAAQWGKIERALAAIEDRWMAHLAGRLDMGQVAVACALGYLDLRHGERGWRNAVPALAAWEATFAQRPAMIATAPPD